MEVDAFDRPEELPTLINREEAPIQQLRTSERVLARVTDGIYREPVSAIRELISNSYDADATWVTVTTDAPNFSSFTIADNGNGMTYELIDHVLRHIGGSPKRTPHGIKLGVVSPSNVGVSPLYNRSLIGKLGIGLFSVSHLTNEFRIVTKTRDSSYQTVGQVHLFQFADENKSEDPNGMFVAGEYKLWTEVSPDNDWHGTTITLTSIRPRIRSTLASQSIWDALDFPENDPLSGDPTIQVPTFHIGRMDPSDPHLLKSSSKANYRSLPWKESTTPDQIMKHLVDGIWSLTSKQGQNVKLERALDYYLRMLWNLALALPVEYVDQSLFNQPASDWAKFYQISNASRGSAIEIPSDPNKSIGQLFELNTDVKPEFRVVFDGVTLKRPIKYRGLPSSSHAVKHPVVFVGSFIADFDHIADSITTGPLSFSAYLIWNSKIVPTEHQGALVRIHGASGSLFDQSFFRYQVAELTRLKQITCEIFIHEGLEQALNIDRESFNTAHPHTVVLTHWLHGALRQVANVTKRLASEALTERRTQRSLSANLAITEIVEEANKHASDSMRTVPEVSFEGQLELPYTDIAADLVCLDLTVPLREAGISVNRLSRGARDRLTAIYKILSVYGTLDDLSVESQTQLMSLLFRVMEISDD